MCKPISPIVLLCFGLACAEVFGCSRSSNITDQGAGRDATAATISSGGSSVTASVDAGNTSDAASPAVSSGGMVDFGDAGPPAGNAKPDSGTTFDFSGPDIIQQTSMPVQSELEVPHTWSDSCSTCNEYQFCDQDHCAYPGKGGIGYFGGMYGHSCPDSPSDPEVMLDPKLGVVCGVHKCVDGLCRSCRTDEDCCLFLGSLDEACLSTVGVQAGGAICLWWDRIQSNACFGADTLSQQGIDLVPLAPK